MNKFRIIPNEYGYHCNSEQLKAYFDLRPYADAWPRVGMPPRKICGYTIYVKPYVQQEEARLASGYWMKRNPHRCTVICPICGLEHSYGRLSQHFKSHAFTADQLRAHLNASGMGRSFKLKAHRLVCNDGVSMSVQASRTHYCTPQSDYAHYVSVECGWPELSTPEWWDSDEIVCGWVDIDNVVDWVNEHGGLNYQESGYQHDVGFEVGLSQRQAGGVK